MYFDDDYWPGRLTKAIKEFKASDPNGFISSAALYEKIAVVSIDGAEQTMTPDFKDFVNDMVSRVYQDGDLTPVFKVVAPSGAYLPVTSQSMTTCPLRAIDPVTQVEFSVLPALNVELFYTAPENC